MTPNPRSRSSAWQLLHLCTRLLGVTGVHAILVGVILMQQSEGGGLGVGGSPSGLMSARGAADFLTRATGILAALFVALSIALAALAVSTTGATKIDTTLDRRIAPAPGAVPAKDPLAVPVAPAGQAPARTRTADCR